MLTIPVTHAVPLHCINEAAIEYHVPARLIISLLQVEQGRVGKIEYNKNGTYDIGPMQINSSWLSELKHHGITQQDILSDPCINIKVGTWLLGKFIASENNLLVGIGDYNSHTKHYNQNYYQKVKINFTKLNLILS